MMKLVLAVLFFTFFVNNANNAHAAENRIAVSAGQKTFSAVIEENQTSMAFLKQLPLTLDMSELNGNEKYFYLDKSLPSSPEKIGKIQAGDIMLYGDNCIVIFYKSFATSYRYTRIAHIENSDGLENALGKGSVTVKFSQR